MRILEKILVTFTCIMFVFFTSLAHSNENEEEKKKGVIILTFDDGPRPWILEKLLPILSKYEIKAVFFVIGKEAEKNPEWIVRLKSEGHLVANHTYSHKCLTKLSNTQIENEIKKTEEIIMKILGKKTFLFSSTLSMHRQKSTRNCEKIKL